MTTASKITLARVALIPVYLILMYASRGEAGIVMWAAMLIFVIASLTDFIDGHIARKYNQVSDFGKFLDPLADKLLTLAAMCMFCQWGKFPAWALMIVLTREFAVSGLRMVAGPKGKVIAAGKSGKFKTASTMVGLIIWMVFPGVGFIGTVVMWMIVITTVYSGVEYFIQNWNCLWD